MDNNEIHYTFPENLDPQKYVLPETAGNNNISFAPREYIIDKIIPEENRILKDILHSDSSIPFGYLSKGQNTTKTIKEASELLGFNYRYILKTIVAKDSSNNIYTITTLGDFGNITKIDRLSQDFIDSHKIDFPLYFELLDENLIEKYTGTKNGFCRPVPLDEIYMNNLEGIFLQNKIRKILGRKDNNVLVTFPVGYHESLLIPPRKLYNLLKDKNPDKVTFFK